MIDKKEIPAIICAGTNGQAVVYGYVDRLPEPKESVTIHQARMVLYWSAECRGLFGLAEHGPKTDTLITSAVKMTKCVAEQALTVSEEAEAAINDWPDA